MPFIAYNSLSAAINQGQQSTSKTKLQSSAGIVNDDSKSLLSSSTGKFEGIKVVNVPRFEHPYRALKLLSVLDPFKTPDLYKKRLPRYKVEFHFIRQDNYCRDSRNYFVHHPESLFTEYNTIADRKLNTPIRNMVQPYMGTDLHPFYGYKKGAKPKYARFELSPKAGMYFTLFMWPRTYEPGKHYACSHQMFSQLPGLNITISKSSMTKLYKDYNDHFKPKPECQPNLMPESFMMDNVTQCREFFEHLNSKLYKAEKKKYSIVYIYKLLNHVHGGKAVMVFDDELEEETRKKFNNGKKCGQFESQLLMQRYLNNPFLVMGHKFDFRVFCMIASTDPLIVYYHDGYLRVSLSEYSPDSKEKSSHITNTGISRDMFKIARENGTWNGMTEDELREFQTWTFERFGKYMYESGQVKDRNWIDNFLRPKMQAGMVHMAKTMQQNLPKTNNFYQFVGVDFILDTDYRLWFIEANVRPGLDGVSRDRTTLVFSTLSDHFEIMFGILRSRMKRVVEYINYLTNTIPVEYINKGINKLANYKEMKSHFEAINKNRIEPEFEPRKENQWVKVIDENLEGPARFANHIPEKCIF